MDLECYEANLKASEKAHIQKVLPKQYPVQKPDHITTWMVLVQDRNTPKRHHTSYKDAKDEAQRLARFTGKPTFLLQVVKKYEMDLTEVSHKNVL